MEGFFWWGERRLARAGVGAELARLRATLFAENGF